LLLYGIEIFDKLKNILFQKRMLLSRLGLLILRQNCRIKLPRLNLAVLNRKTKEDTKNIFIFITKNYSTDGEPKRNLKFSTRNFQQKADASMKNAVWYILSGFVIMIGASYAGKVFFNSNSI